MIRVLLMIAAAGFVLCVACFAGAFAIGGHDLIARGGWNLISDGDFHRGDWPRRGEAQVTRQIAWSGDTLVADFPANIRYVQGEGPATITGPASIIKEVVVKDGELTLPGRNRTRGMTITLTAPGVNKFEVRSVADLSIENYRQDTLVLKMTGSGDAHVEGQAASAEVSVTGSGDADLSDLGLNRAKVDVSGSGDVLIAPKEAADVKLSASGDVRLLSRPAQLTTQMTASGRVEERGRDKDEDDGERVRGPGKSV